MEAHITIKQDLTTTSASFPSARLVSSTSVSRHAASNTGRSIKRKTEDEYKEVPDPAFPIFMELHKLATRGGKVRNHSAFISECLAKGNIYLLGPFVLHIALNLALTARY